MIKAQKRILCTGIYRSGSTWLFNVVRHIFIQQGIKFQSGLPMNIDEKSNDPVHIIKLHPYRTELIYGNINILSTVRDLRDIAASAYRRKMKKVFDHQGFSREMMFQFLDETVRCYHGWKPHVEMEIRFEEMMQDKQGHIARVADKLEQDIDIRAVHEAVEALPLPKGKANYTTLLWPNHVTKHGTQRSLLDISLIDEITERYEDFLKETSYL